MPRAKIKKDYDSELDGKRLYVTTRKNEIVPRGTGAISFEKEVSASYTNPALKKKIIHHQLRQKFLSQFTFFPLYDCDNNSYIRLYRLHAQFKHSYKNRVKRVITTTEFSKCVKILNEYFFHIIIREQEEIKIGTDYLFAFRKRNRYKVSTQRSPVRLLWSVTNPYKSKDPTRLMFPKIKNLIGRPDFKHLKVLAKEFNTTTLLQDIPYLSETEFVKRNRDKRLDKTITSEFIDALESDMDFNMFNDF